MQNEIKDDDLEKCLALLPAGVREILFEFGSKLVVAGGLVRSVVAGEQVADVDVFARGSGLAHVCAERLSKTWQEIYGAKVAVHSSSLAVTVRVVGREGILPVQFCHRWSSFQDASELIGRFDFTVCKAAFWHDGSRWCSLVDPTFYESVEKKRLRYCSPDREEAPGDSLLRVLKYYRRGYRIGLWDLGRVVSRLLETGEGDDEVGELVDRLRKADHGSDEGEAAFFHD